MNNTYLEKREALLPAVEKSEEELKQALGELQTAVQKKFDLGERFAEHSMGLLAGGFLFGLWLGIRRD